MMQFLKKSKIEVFAAQFALIGLFAEIGLDIKGQG